VPTLFQALDTFDANMFARFLTDERVFVFGNFEPVIRFLYDDWPFTEGVAASRYGKPVKKRKLVGEY